MSLSSGDEVAQLSGWPKTMLKDFWQKSDLMSGMMGLLKGVEGVYIKRDPNSQERKD